jgi:hypothetical protein
LFQHNRLKLALGPIHNLTNNATGDNATAPVVAAAESYVYVAWEQKPAANKHIETYFKATSDDADLTGGQGPFVAATNGKAYAVRVDNNIDIMFRAFS